MATPPTDPPRRPPDDVRRTLRREVGFGCPVEGCGSPYLTLHHFDPPWRDRKHHDPAGMIALCKDHHAEAETGRFTLQELRALKEQGGSGEPLKGRFDWMRQKVLTVAGGNFYWENPIAVQLGNDPMVWFPRDEEGHLLLNLRMPTLSGQPRILIEDNFWISPGIPDDIECPPHGRKVVVRYANGDLLGVQFLPDLDLQELQGRHPAQAATFELLGIGVEEPVAVVEIRMTVAGAGIDFLPGQTRIGGSQFIGNVMADNSVGLKL